MPPNFKESVVVSTGTNGPDFASSRIPEDTIAEQATAFGQGANTLLLRDVVGGAVDLMNQLPVIMQDISFSELAETGVRSGIREIQRQIGTEEEDLIAPFERRYQAQPFSEAPVGRSTQMGDILQQTEMGYGDISQVRPSLRPYAVAGETVAGATTAAIPFFNLARTRQLGGVPRMLDPIVKFIQQNPNKASAIELASILLSGGGAGVAERLAPGNPYARLAGEVAGPFLPLHLAMRYGPQAARNLYESATTYFKEPARTNRAARKLQDLMADVEGPKAALMAARNIDRARTGGLAGTPAQLTGSPVLTAIERELVKVSQKLGGDVATETNRAIQQSRQAWDALQETGDIESIRKASQALTDAHLEFLDQRLAKVLELEQQAVARVDIPGARSRPEISEEARRLLERTKETAKLHYDELYAKIPETQVITPTNLAAKVDEIMADFVSGEAFPSSLAGALRKAARTNEEGELVTEFTSGQLKKMRTTLLKEARAAKRRPHGEGDTDNVTLNQLAASIFDDLAFGAEGRAARDFYRGYADRFKRGAGGKLFYHYSQGQLLPDEAALDSILGGMANIYGSGFKGLRRAEAIPLPDELRRAAGLELTTPSNLSRLQSEFIMRMAAKTIDFNGTVKLGALRTFMRDNETAIKELGITQLGDLESAALAAQRMAAEITKRKNSVGNRSVVSRIIANPSAQIRNALDATGETTNQQFRNLSRIAQRNPDTAEKAMDGLRTGLFEELLARAGNESGVISGRRLSEILDAPMRSAERGVTHPSLREILKTHGILTSRHDKGINLLIDRLTKLERGMNNPAVFDDLMGEWNDFYDLAYRVFGTQMAQRSPISQNVGSQLVMARAGSKMARKWLGSMPLVHVRGILIDAVSNPDLMAQLLTRPVTLKAKREKQRAINAFLMQAGLRVTATDEETE
jgi:hypothetical protein